MAIPALIAVGAALLYLPQLRDAPFYLNRDEMFFGLTAHSLASTGRDTTGRFLPLYFQTQMRYGSEMWFQPMLMYAIAASVRLFGFSEGTIRLPMALAGVADVVLVYFIARLLFDRELPAIAAAILLALAPAHLINSRIAMDFQAPLPFMLAWLLCLLLYLRRGRPAMLFAAGLLLGIGVYTYIAAYMLMPIYALLTCVVLYQRREPLERYATLAAGFVVPLLCALPYLIVNPTVLHDVLWHYEREKPLNAGATDLLAAFFSYDRFATAASVYWRFWTPRFLFINGPQSLWFAGAFLLPTAGLLAAGVWHVRRRSAAAAVLLIGALLTAPIPASLVGDADAIHRAAEVLPFGVLLAVAGLDALWSAQSGRARALTFVAVWAILIGLAAMYHDVLPFAQAIIRAATVPLAVAALYLLLRDVSIDRLRSWRFAVAALGTLASLEIGYVLLGYAIVSWALAAVAIAALLVRLPDMIDRRIQDAWVPVVLATASSLFMHAYGDYSGIHRVQAVPATAIVMAVRFLYASCGMAAMVGVALFVRSARLDRVSRRQRAALVAAAILVLQFGYFHIDYFSDYRWRLIHASGLMAAAVAAAWLATTLGRTRVGLGQLTAVALLGVVCIQFTYFYVDYLTQYRVRSGNLEPEGNSRAAWETVIARARLRPVPAVYLGSVGPYGFGDLYWKFYAIKHNRQDLLTRTVSDVAFEPARVRSLPDTSLAVTSPSPETDHAIERMLAAGEIRGKTLVIAPDGASRFWILETSARTPMTSR